MGANEKHEATYHSGEYDFGSADPVSANRARFMSESELDRFIAKIRNEAKAEALEEFALDYQDFEYRRRADAGTLAQRRANELRNQS